MAALTIHKPLISDLELQPLPSLLLITLGTTTQYRVCGVIAGTTTGLQCHCNMAAQRTDLYKFPRTKHLFDAGGSGVSRDDLLMDKGEEGKFYCSRSSGKKGKLSNDPVVVVEEKVDGANLGISVGPDMTVLVQNRSHYVNSQTHRQFSTLDSWIEEHRAGLVALLEPGRHVLFGEWLYAKHSIHYTRLPDKFLGFDIYDRDLDVFYISSERDKLLHTAGIESVRSITETTLTGRENVS